MVVHFYCADNTGVYVMRVLLLQFSLMWFLLLREVTVYNIVVNYISLVRLILRILEASVEGPKARKCEFL